MSAQLLLAEHTDRIREQVVRLGLDDFLERILTNAYSAYDLVGVKQSGSRKQGTTRFGGHPDLPESFNTEELDGFEFVYQVNCSDLPDAKTLGLPTDGLLSVFSNSEPYDGGKALYSPPTNWIRHRMPDPCPDYIFSNVKPWQLEVTTSVGLAQYGDDLYFDIEEAGLSDAYEDLLTEFDTESNRRFGQILGRFSDLNGDMRRDAADECGGKPADWRSLWKVFSSFDSGLVISDFHELHAMIRKRHLRELNFSKAFTTQTNG